MLNLVDHTKCERFNNMRFCLKCKMFYDNAPTYFENLYKEKQGE
jgi:hypothetical protein